MMKPIIREIDEKYIEVIGHYDDIVLCAKMTLLADLYAIKKDKGYALFRVEDYDKLANIDGRLRFSVSDLTGTTWVFNNNIDYGGPVSGQNPYDVNISFNSNSISYDKIRFSHDSEDSWVYYVVSAQNIYDTAYTSYDDWENNAYKTITITGGTDATNSNLIAWLEANAVQQQSTPVISPSFKSVSVSTGTNTVTIDIEGTSFEMMKGVFLKDKILIPIGKKIYWSDIKDGKNFSVWNSLPSNTNIRSIAYGNGMFVVLLDKYLPDNILYTTDDGQTWTYTSSPTNFDYVQSLQFGNGIFVIDRNPSQNGTRKKLIASSSDCENWTQANISASVNSSNTPLYFINGYFTFYLDSSSTTVSRRYSSDAINWSSSSNETWNYLFYGSLDQMYIESNAITEFLAGTSSSTYYLRKETYNLTNFPSGAITTSASNSSNLYGQTNRFETIHTGSSTSYFPYATMNGKGLGLLWNFTSGRVTPDSLVGLYTVNLSDFTQTKICEPENIVDISDYLANERSGNRWTNIRPQKVFETSTFGIFMIDSSYSVSSGSSYTSYYHYNYYHWDYTNDTVTRITNLPNETYSFVCRSIKV